MTAAEFYKLYQADNEVSDLSHKLIKTIKSFDPVHVLDFGCGSGKHMKMLNSWGVDTHGIDISKLNVCTAMFRNEVKSVSLGNENYLRHYCNFDIVTTCSVLDHVENIDGIISEFKRIANKAIVIAETNDVPGPYYYPHDYESLGFARIPFEWKSSKGDGATYYIWVWEKKQEVTNEPE